MSKIKQAEKFGSFSYNISRYFSENVSSNLKEKTYRKDERKIKSVIKFSRTLADKIS